MTSNAHAATPILGSLRSADGKGVVRIEDGYDTNIDDLWSAITDPARLARWHAQVEGDLRAGGEVPTLVQSHDLGSTGRIVTREATHPLVATNKEDDEIQGHSY